MTCSACSSIVEAALRTVPGVTNAVVSLLQQVARVEHDPAVAVEVPPTLAQEFFCFLVVLSCCRQPNSAKQHLSICSVPTAGGRCGDRVHRKLAWQGRHQ